MRMAHISDLHVTSRFFDEELASRLVDTLNTGGYDLVVISGDLTMEGHVGEYENAKVFLDRIAPEKLIVPGNHDSFNRGYEIFEEMFGTRKPVFSGDGVRICGMDSSEPDLNEGKLGRHNYKLIRERLSGDDMKFLVLHHHIIPVPGTGRENNILMDSGDVLKLCVDLDVNFVLSGHRHLPWVWKLNHTYFVTAGTASTRRLKGRSYPSFNRFEIDGGRAVMYEVNLDTMEEYERIRT
ncbi:MAG: metallophosphoesterase [Thermoplasmata archaeon]|nr:metallophosphoesterase [Thermoplasmata archaeon]